MTWGAPDQEHPLADEGGYSYEGWLDIVEPTTGMGVGSLRIVELRNFGYSPDPQWRTNRLQELKDLLEANGFALRITRKMQTSQDLEATP